MLTEAEQIEAIFQAYPRHIGKRAALKAIEKAVGRHETMNATRESTRRWLWKKATEYAKSPAGQKPNDPAQDFRPHPSTFFNQDRFLDDPDEWQKPNGSRNGKTIVTASTDQIARANAKIAELGGNHLRAR